MTDQPTPGGPGEPAPPGSSSEPPPLTSPAEPAALSSTPPPPPAPTFEERMHQFGRDADAAGQRLGREAQEAGERLSRDPALLGVADLVSRAFGLIVLGFGVWFLFDITLGYDMPAIAWGDIWPLVLIVLGLVVVLRGAARRT